MYPDTPILIQKFDWKLAYRQIHHAPDYALESSAQLDNVLLLTTRLTFGGSPKPQEWSILSEVGCDLVNSLIQPYLTLVLIIPRNHQTSIKHNSIKLKLAAKS